MFQARLRIARVPVALRVHGPFRPDHFEHRFGPYADRDEPPGRAASSELASPEGAAAPAAFSLTLWLELLGKNLATEVPYPGVKAYVTPGGVKLLGSGLSMWLSPADGRAEAFVSGLLRLPPPAFDEDAGPADTPLRILVTHSLLEREQGALVHACGLIHRGRGVLLIGPGGAGKSTSAGLARPGQVLSDDQVALLADPGGRLMLASTPFVGMYGRVLPPTEVPLAALVVLDRHRAGRLEPLERFDALRAFLGCLPLYTRTPQTATYALGLAELVARVVPLWKGAPRLGSPLEDWLEGLGL